MYIYKYISLVERYPVKNNHHLNRTLTYAKSISPIVK